MPCHSNSCHIGSKGPCSFHTHSTHRLVFCVWYLSFFSFWKTPALPPRRYQESCQVVNTSRTTARTLMCANAQCVAPRAAGWFAEPTRGTPPPNGSVRTSPSGCFIVIVVKRDLAYRYWLWLNWRVSKCPQQGRWGHVCWGLESAAARVRWLWTGLGLS